MNRADRGLRALLRWVWDRSLARLAPINIAPPGEIPLSEVGSSVRGYLRAAVVAAAPWSTLAMVLATLAGTVANLSQSLVLGQVTNQALAGRRDEVMWLLAALMALWLMGPLMQALHSIGRLYASQNLRIAVTDNLTARLMRASPRAMAEQAVGNVVERVELTSTSVAGVVCSCADTFVKLLSVAVLASVALASVSPSLALLACGWMLTALLMSSYLAFTGMGIVEDASDAHARVIADLAELVTNVALVRSFSGQAFERRRFAEVLRADLVACRRVRSYWVFVMLIEGVYKWVFGLALTFLAIRQYGSGSLDLPQLVTVGSLVIALSWHFESVAFQFVDLFDALGVLRAGLGELSRIDVELEEGGLPQLPRPGAVQITDVSLSLGGKSVLRELSLSIEPGSKVGIVGPSGSGKSSLLALLRGELVPDAGQVELHGLPLGTCSAGALAGKTSEALQSALMFNRSIRDNVAYAVAAPDDGAVERALEEAQATEIVRRQPQGLGGVIGERGALMSTGERQRLNIARALLKQAPLVVFDEATSSVDAMSEERIVRHLVDGLPGCTVIVVTHRVTTLERFDCIVVMDRGRIVDVGSPRKLAARSELFRHLVARHGTDADAVESVA